MQRSCVTGYQYVKPINYSNQLLQVCFTDLIINNIFCFIKQLLEHRSPRSTSVPPPINTILALGWLLDNISASFTKCPTGQQRDSVEAPICMPMTVWSRSFTPG